MRLKPPSHNQLHNRPKDPPSLHPTSSPCQLTKFPQAGIPSSHFSTRGGFHTGYFIPFCSKQNIICTSILHLWSLRLQYNLLECLSFFSILKPKVILYLEYLVWYVTVYEQPKIQYAKGSMEAKGVFKKYLLVEFPCICIMHFDSLPISLELKGRTLTATFTEAPDIVAAVVFQSHRKFS